MKLSVTSQHVTRRPDTSRKWSRACHFGGARHGICDLAGGSRRRRFSAHGRRAWGIIGHIRSPFARPNIYPPTASPPTRLPSASSGQAQRLWIMSPASTSPRHTVCRVLECFSACWTKRRARCRSHWMPGNDGVGPLSSSVSDSTELFFSMYGITSLQVCHTHCGGTLATLTAPDIHILHVLHGRYCTSEDTGTPYLRRPHNSRSAKRS